MLVIIERGGRETIYHLSNVAVVNSATVENILYIQADGDERTKIESMFPKWRVNGSSPVAYWWGDIAKTIAMNF